MSFCNWQTDSQIEYRRSIHDYFATPAPITEALLERESFEGLIWEPACGEGWMSETLIKHGYDVMSTDLIDRGYGQGGKDFFQQRTVVPNIITNPPFIDGLYLPFPRHALKLATRKVAMLLPVYTIQNMWFGQLVFERPLKTIYLFRTRVYTVAEGNKHTRKTNVAFAWFVWDKQYKGKPTFEPINVAGKKRTRKRRRIILRTTATV